jgi:hypothetical protein
VRRCARRRLGFWQTYIFAALIRLAVRLKAYWNLGSCACMARGHQRFCFICVLGNVQNIKGIVSFSPSYAHVSYHLYLMRPVPSRCRFKLYACGHAFSQQRKTTCRLDRGLISQHACVGVFRFPRPAPDCPTIIAVCPSVERKPLPKHCGFACSSQPICKRLVPENVTCNNCMQFV